ncbi:MAG: hypothetical protein IPN90_04300 [Elusimicrobia bacterium]|nr:hypothetical protein [Elusimicrobiota bacterium]
MIVGDTIANDLLDEGEQWAHTWVDQASVSESTNHYVVIQGQALLAGSETKSWSAELSDAGVFTKVEAAGDIGYSLTSTAVLNTYNDEGLLTGAMGRTEIHSVERVKTLKWVDGYVDGDTDKDKVKDADEDWKSEWVDQANLTEVVNTYGDPGPSGGGQERVRHLGREV